MEPNIFKLHPIAKSGQLLLLSRFPGRAYLVTTQRRLRAILYGAIRRRVAGDDPLKTARRMGE
jgi:hypothetical protein